MITGGHESAIILNQCFGQLTPTLIFSYITCME